MRVTSLCGAVLRMACTYLQLHGPHLPLTTHTRYIKISLSCRHGHAALQFSMLFPAGHNHYLARNVMLPFRAGAKGDAHSRDTPVTQPLRRVHLQNEASIQLRQCH